MKQEIHLNENQLREMVYNVIMEAANEGYGLNLLGRAWDAGKGAVKKVGGVIGKAATQAGEAVKGAYDAAVTDYQNYNAEREPLKRAKKDAKEAYKGAQRMDRDVNGYKDDDYAALDKIAQRYKPYDNEISYLIGQVKRKIYQMGKTATSQMTKTGKAYGTAKDNLRTGTRTLDKTYGRQPAATGIAAAPAAANLEEAVMAAVDRILNEMVM